MTFATLAARNLTRNKTRVILTVLGVAVAVMAFLIFRTVIWAFSVGKEFAAKDRIATRDAVSFIQRLPRNYVDKMAAIPGVKAITWFDWWGGQDPRDKNNFFGTFAVNHRTFLDVYPEVVISPEAREKWMTDKQSALVGDVLATKLKVKEGDDVNLTTQIYGRGETKFHVAGIYHVTQKSLDRSSFYFHWDYMNDNFPEGRPGKDKVGWVLSRIDDPSKSASISKQIDDMFAVTDQATLTMSERALNTSFLGGFSAVLSVIDFVSIVILGIMMLILGNTIAMGVRERTAEYGTLLAVGFEPKHIASFVVLESAFVGLLGGLIGLAFGSFIIHGVAPFLEEGPMSNFFPFFALTAQTAAIGLGLALVLGGLAATLPAFQASRLNVSNALRKVG
jgi:putative ABC transport system permease protein